jgi:hypothetical protein
MSRHCFTALHSLTEGIGLQSGQEITESRFVAELQQQLGTSAESGVKYVLQQFQSFVFEDILKLFLGIRRSHKQGYSIPSFNSNSVQVNLGNSGHLNQDFTPDTRMNTVINHVISYNMSHHADGQIMH